MLLLSERGHLGPSQARSFLTFEVDVPERSHTLSVRLRWMPAQVAGIRNLVTIGLYDANGCRGAGHRHAPEQEVTVSLTEASPGFIPGPLTPGRWQVELALHAVLPSLTGGLDYVLDVEVEPEAEDADLDTEVPAAEPIEPQGPDEPAPPLRWKSRTSVVPEGWLKGDLHFHSNHSDGRWTVDDVVEYARANDLDFLALTDHNTVSGREHLRRAVRRAGLSTIVLDGIELTTFWGHANVLGVPEWIDWRTFEPGRSATREGSSNRHAAVMGRDGTRPMAEAAAEARERGGLFVVNHPRSAGYPKCTGCRWDYGDETPDFADVIEVMNGPWNNRQNAMALELWDRWLNLGHRLCATAGTDSHGYSRHPELLGFTYVQADPSQASILEAVRAGRSYLSRGPSLVWTSPALGEPLPAHADSVSVRVGGVRDVVDVSLVAGGKRIGRERIENDGTVRFELDPGATSRRWYRVELYPKGKKDPLALTNPVFVE